jgi:hypothetical protein
MANIKESHCHMCVCKIFREGVRVGCDGNPSLVPENENGERALSVEELSIADTEGR